MKMKIKRKMIMIIVYNYYDDTGFTFLHNETNSL